MGAKGDTSSMRTIKRC